MLIPVGLLKMKLILEDDFSVPFKPIIIIFTQTISTFLYIVWSFVLTGRVQVCSSYDLVNVSVIGKSWFFLCGFTTNSRRLPSD